MLNIIAGALISMILVMFVVIAIPSFFFSNNVKYKSKKTVIIGIGILFGLFIIFGGISATLHYNYITAPEISTIEIKDVYFDEYVHSNTLKESYIVVDANDKLHTITTDKICKGDSNYLIIYTQPKLTSLVAVLIGKDKQEYELILTDPENIPSLSRIPN